MIISKNYDETLTLHSLSQSELTVIRNALIFFQKNTENEDAAELLNELDGGEGPSHLSLKLRKGLSEARNWQH